MAEPKRISVQQTKEKMKSGSLLVCIYGQESYDEFREKVPPNSYETVSPFIEKEKRGEPYSFSPGRILFYEKTSGSSGPAKYIPYNAALKSSFNNAFLLWAVDVP